ncbi:MAG TPA: alcohol dehydrogenase catalytic domain-containing protein [Candidatus Nitrosocosmicus sp.]|nr:alcohol dehydrogenase catalytic domain-containing protein [Candidatus Nitrosocosmicus sp.]
MKALFYSKPGIENLTCSDYQLTDLIENEVLIETRFMSVNPIDYYTITGIHGINGPQMKISPFPHIPGTEIAGIVKRKGPRVKSEIVEGDRVIVYNRLFDGTCKYCGINKEMLCINGGMIGLVTNGGYAEYVKIPAQNILKIPDQMSWEVASALPVAGLTALNAIEESGLKAGEYLLIFGGSGNTGLFCSQIGKIMGAKTISISSKSWVADFGADFVFENSMTLKKEIAHVTSDSMVDVVINPLGELTWNQGMNVIGKMGTIVTYGVLTGGNLITDGRLLYNNQITIKGTTGGSLSGLAKLINMVKAENIRTKIWKRFSLEDSKRAVESLFDKNREGRIIIENQG